jgi:hypothetical protein
MAVDSFRPIKYHGTVNKRQAGKGWGVLVLGHLGGVGRIHGDIFVRQLPDGHSEDECK